MGKDKEKEKKQDSRRALAKKEEAMTKVAVPAKLSKETKKDSGVVEPVKKHDIPDEVPCCAALYPQSDNTDYSLFIDCFRSELGVAQHGNRFILPSFNQPEYTCVEVYASETQKMRLMVLKNNAYGIAVSIEEEGVEEKEEWYFLKDYASRPESKIISRSENYNHMRADAGFDDLGEVKIGKGVLTWAYNSLKLFIETYRDDDKKLTYTIRRNSARAMLTLIFLVCEAGRFESIKNEIMKKFELDYSALENNNETKWIENRVLGWSSGAKCLDDDIRLFQNSDWEEMISNPEHRAKLME